MWGSALALNSTSSAGAIQSAPEPSIIHAWLRCSITWIIFRQVQELLKPIMLRRVKADVELELPPKIETKILVPLTALQKVWYKRLVTKEVFACAAIPSFASGSQCVSVPLL